VLLVTILFLVGCAGVSKFKTVTVTDPSGKVTRTETSEKTDYAVQLETVKAVNGQPKQPLVRIKAASGVQVTGLDSIEVYEHTDQVAIPAPPKNEAMELVRDIAGNGRDVAIVGKVADVVGKLADDKAPPPNITNTTNTTTTTNTVSGKAVIGGGTLKNVDGNGAVDGTFTDTQDSHNSDSHNADSHNADNHTNNNAAPVIP